MENIETKNPAPRWYKVALALWGPVSLAGGGLVAYYILDLPPSSTVWLGTVANLAQVILLGLLITQGLQYYTVKQLLKRFLLVFLVIAVIPLVLTFVSTEGEMPLGVLTLIILLAITIPQIIFTLLYSLARKLFRSSVYKGLALAVVVHVGFCFFILQFLANN